LQSKACHLSGMSGAELVEAGEEEDCWGGFFVVKGHERLVRMLINTRKNYPVALQRHSWKSRGPLFTEKGIFLRSVSEDLRSVVSVPLAEEMKRVEYLSFFSRTTCCTF